MEDNLWAPAKVLRSFIQEEYRVPDCDRCKGRHACISYRVLKEMEEKAGETQGRCEACTSYELEED